jgi:pimeloyl-ACP methyl ester carboxylesterase
VIGHSLGGYVALAMAALDEEFCKKLVLFHSIVYADSDEKKANRDKAIDFVTKNGVASFMQTFVPSLFFNKHHPEISRVRSICEKTSTETLVAYTKAMRDRPSREELLKNYQYPALILAGDKDEIIPVESSRKMGSISSKSIFFALPDTGHMGMIECETLALKKMIEFIGM